MVKSAGKDVFHLRIRVLNSNGVVLVEFFTPWCPVNLNRMLLITRRSSLRELVSRIVRSKGNLKILFKLFLPYSKILISLSWR
ncbi:unnamed protein product [Arabidopsis halleri]